MEFLAKDIFKRSYFKSYSEFYLALSIGNVLHTKGHYLNMDGMQVDSDSLPNTMIAYYKKLLNSGALVLSMYQKSDTVIENAAVDVNTYYFEKLPLFYEEDGHRGWSVDYAISNYKGIPVNYLSTDTMGNLVMHLVAYNIVDCLLNNYKKKLVIHFDSFKARTTFLYVNVYSCLSTIKWLKEYVELDVDLTGYSVDLDYSIFCNNGYVAGHNKPHTVSEKLGFMKKFGMVEGSLLVLWHRERMNENNPFGKIVSASIIRLDEIGDTYLGVTKISLNRTKEEVEADYYDIEESKRHLYVDLLDKKPYQEATELGIHSLGVDNYFYDEEDYITLLDDTAQVTKLVTIDGEKVHVEMSNTDAIYWLLRQYDIEFDRELFKEMYFGDDIPLWDKYNSDIK